MWQDYMPGSSRPRRVKISAQMKDAIDRYTADKDCSVQHLFDVALITLWRLWNGHTETIEPKDSFTEKMVVDIYNDNIMPKGRLNKEVYLRFKGDVTYAWACSIDKLYLTEGLYEFIRRTICYYLREKEYLKDEVYDKFFKKEEANQNLDIDTIK